MAEDPSFDPPRGLILARVFAIVGCAAAGAFAFLWMQVQEDAATELARREADSRRIMGDGIAEARKAARERADHEISTERAKHARELAAARGKEGDALVARLDGIQAERDGLLQALATSRERSQRLRDDVKRLQREIEAAVQSGDARMQDAARRWASQLSRATEELDDAEAEASARQARLQALEARLRDPRDGALAKTVAAHIDAAYAALEPSGAPEVTALVSSLGRGPWLLPFLTEQFSHEVRGIWAATHAAQLSDIDHAMFIAGCARARRTDLPFTNAAGNALLAGDSSGRDDRIVAALGHSECCVRLIAVAAALAASANDGVVHPGFLLAIANDEAVVRQRALESAAAETAVRRHRLIRALAERSLPEGVRRRAWRAFLEGPGDDLPALAAVAMAAPSVVEEGEGHPELSGDRRAALLGELLAHAPRPQVIALRKSLMTAVFGARSSQDWRRAVNQAELRPHVLAAALRVVPGDPDRAAARAVLPVQGVVMDGPEGVVALAAVARPAHLPYLVANASAAAPVSRVQAASALHRLGHPGGKELLGDLVNARETDVRVAALLAYADLRLPHVEALVMRRLHEPSPIRDAAVAAVARLELAIPHDFLPVVLDCEPPVTRVLLDAVGRTGDPVALSKTLLRELGAGNVLDGETVATWVFEAARRPSAEACRAAWRHRHPAARARAIEASRALETDLEPAAAVAALDPFVDDGDFRVRIQVARSLAGIRHDLARTTLVRLAKDESPWVRDEAIQGLGCQERYHVIPVLRSASHDPSPYVRNAALVAMIAHGVKTETKPVLDALDDPRLGLRTRRALDRILGRTYADRAAYARAIQDL